MPVSLFAPDLGEALTTTASEQVSGMVTAMYTIVEYINDDGEQMVAFTVAPNQKATTSAGLLALAASISEHELRCYVGEMYGREEP